MKQAYINKLAGKDLFPTQSWIKHDKEGPKGPFRYLFTKLKKPHKALSALMVYSVFVSKKVTKTQEQKFYGSLEAGKSLDSFQQIASMTWS
jgi:hypothetical protein